MPKRLAVERSAILSLAAVVLGLALTPDRPARANADQLAYGKHLSQECTSCHRRDGSDTGIPVIIGLEPGFFVTTMKFYQSGARTNQVMNSVAQTLNDEQLQALATYFASLKPATNAADGTRRKK